MMFDIKRTKQEINLFNLQKQKARLTTSKLSILTADLMTTMTPTTDAVAVASRSVEKLTTFIRCKWDHCE
jgi:hypothetical protein